MLVDTGYDQCFHFLQRKRWTDKKNQIHHIIWAEWYAAGIVLIIIQAYNNTRFSVQEDNNQVEKLTIWFEYVVTYSRVGVKLEDPIMKFSGLFCFRNYKESSSYSLTLFYGNNPKCYSLISEYCTHLGWLLERIAMIWGGGEGVGDKEARSEGFDLKASERNEE